MLLLWQHKINIKMKKNMDSILSFLFWIFILWLIIHYRKPLYSFLGVFPFVFITIVLIMLLFPVIEKYLNLFLIKKNNTESLSNNGEHPMFKKSQIISTNICRPNNNEIELKELNLNNEIAAEELITAHNLLDHIVRLADIINTTIDKAEFENSLSEIKSSLKTLSQYEKYNIFGESTPTKDLKRIEENELLTRKKFSERVNKKETGKNHQKNYSSQKPKPKKSFTYFNVEQYARMCNASLDHEDEMEQYKNVEYEDEYINKE